MTYTVRVVKDILCDINYYTRFGMYTRSSAYVMAVFTLLLHF